VRRSTSVFTVCAGATCRKLVDAGVVEPLVSQLRHAEPDRKEHAAVALARLAAYVDARKRISVAGAVPVLVASLPTLGAKGMEGAVLCLEKLVTLQEAAEQTMREPVRHNLLPTFLMSCQPIYVAS
jgi:hypothetical protein